MPGKNPWSLKIDHGEFGKWLSDRDSNPDWMDQNHLCYHYTIGQRAPNLTSLPPGEKQNP